jgi:hypothetical protein
MSSKRYTVEFRAEAIRQVTEREIGRFITFYNGRRYHVGANRSFWRCRRRPPPPIPR